MKVKEFISRARYSEASGSTAVISENIRMELNEFGIYEEKIDLDSESELDPLVEFVSPNFNTEVNELDLGKTLYADVEGIEYDKKIGYYKSLYAGYVSEGDYRQQASSGGMGTWILKELFERDLIDGVIHVKENLDDDSIMFKYDISKSLEEIIAGAKTRYYPVELSGVLKRVKEEPGRYAIVGIPSFIMAVRLLAEKDEMIKERIKFTIGLICGHQKSSKFAEFLAWQVGIKPENLKSIDFRKKLLDRPANNYGVEITGTIDGEELTIVKPTSELLGQNWGQGFFKTTSSDFTDDVMNETADITLGDAWLPEYSNDSKGNNIVIVRHPVIHDLIKDGINSQSLNLDEIDKSTIIRSQSAHYRHTHDELAYRLYKIDVKNEWRPSKRVKSSNKLPLLRRKVQDLREDISVSSHVLFKEALELNDLNYFILQMNKKSKRYKFVYKFINMQQLGVVGSIKKILKIRPSD